MCHNLWRLVLLLHPLGAAGNSCDADSRHLDEAERHHEGNELLDLVALAGDLEDEVDLIGIVGAGAELIG